MALAATQSLAGPTDTAPQVATARQNAVASLKQQVDGIDLGRRLTVGDFLSQAGCVDAIAELENKARPLGGPRWTDDQTVQVKLELPGADLVTQLVSIAATHPEAGVSSGVIEQRLRGLRSVSLIGSGSCQNVPTLRPSGLSDAWEHVSDQQRGLAVAEAREDAHAQLLHAVSSLPLDAQTVGDLLKRPAIAQAARAWLSTQPAGEVRYTDDLQVQMTVSASQAELVRVIADAARASGVAVDDARLGAVIQPFAHATLSGVGHGAVGALPGAPASGSVLPTQPPAWLAQPIDAQGLSPRLRTPLLTKAAAEAQATDALRAQIRTLRLDQFRTIGDAAQTDPRIEAAISSALLRAHVFKVEIRADGAWLVRITLDTRDLWEELTQAVGS